jgi:hypothetical protein
MELPMLRPRIFLTVAALVGSVLTFAPIANAQMELRRGILPFTMLQSWAGESSTTVSQGFLADLQTDEYFEGDYLGIVEEASQILSGYTVVRRGGYFPENAGIPREQQLTTVDSVYRIYRMGNNRELVLYRSPTENTSRYLIRNPGSATQMQMSQ